MTTINRTVYKHEYNIKNREKIKENKHKYYEANKEKITESKKKYVEVNKERIKEYKHNYYETNKERLREKRKNYYKSNKVKWKRRNSITNTYLIPKYKNVPCMDCNTIFPFIAMDFDHRPGEVKSFTISVKGCWKATSERIEEIEKEISKCDLVCSNCHRIRTWNRSNSRGN